MPTPEELARITNDNSAEIRFNKEQRARRHMTANSSTVRLAAMFRALPRLREQLELTDEQATAIASIASDYESSKEEIKLRTEPNSQDQRNQLGQLERECRDRLEATILPFQFEKMAAWNWEQNGFVCVLIETEVGNAMELSERQKASLREQSEAMAAEIEEFINAKRREFADMLHEELNSDQREQLAELVGEERLDRILSSQPIETIFAQNRAREMGEDVSEGYRRLRRTSDLPAWVDR